MGWFSDIVSGIGDFISGVVDTVTDVIVDIPIIGWPLKGLRQIIKWLSETCLSFPVGKRSSTIRIQIPPL